MPLHRAMTDKAQDGFCQLVEECRLGRVLRTFLFAGATEYKEHNPHIDLADVPVFFLGEMPEQFSVEVDVALASIREGQFKLPYPRCAFMHVASRDHPATQIGKWADDAAREYVTVTEEEEDGSILVYSFIRSSKMKHWAKQVWQGLIPGPDDPERDLLLSYDPISIDTNPEFLDLFLASNEKRMHYLVSQVHRIVTGHGSVTYAVGGTHTQRVDKRRAGARLPMVPRVRIIELDPAPVVIRRSSSSSGTGSPKSPHFRRGGWRELATGRRVWVRASAIHGGTPDQPPWYEVKEPRK